MLESRPDLTVLYGGREFLNMLNVAGMHDMHTPAAQLGTTRAPKLAGHLVSQEMDLHSYLDIDDATGHVLEAQLAAVVQA